MESPTSLHFHLHITANLTPNLVGSSFQTHPESTPSEHSIAKILVHNHLEYLGLKYVFALKNRVIVQKLSLWHSLAQIPQCLSTQVSKINSSLPTLINFDLTPWHLPSPCWLFLSRCFLKPAQHSYLRAFALFPLLPRFFPQGITWIPSWLSFCAYLNITFATRSSITTYYYSHSSPLFLYSLIPLIDYQLAHYVFMCTFICLYPTRI